MNLIKTTESGLMKFADLDAVAGNVLAEITEVRHQQVLSATNKAKKAEDIRKSGDISDVTKIMIPEQNNPNFNAIWKKWEYTKRGKTFPTFIMNEDALFLTLAYLEKTQEVHNALVWFKSEFNRMRIERSEREISKQLHRPFTDQVQHLYYGLKKEGSKLRDEAMLHTNFAVKIRKAVAGKKVKRDELTPEQNLMVSEIEDNVAMQLQYCFDNGWTARETRANVYAFIAEFAA